ncbi:MAG: ABC transporter permease subunit [Clostridium sp.]|nr:ABC transporter permease subunit [Clostridium sp.]
MLIYIAGLQSIPPDLIEAARIDGASAADIIFRIKLPMLSPVIMLVRLRRLTILPGITTCRTSGTLMTKWNGDTAAWAGSMIWRRKTRPALRHC